MPDPPIFEQLWNPDTPMGNTHREINRLYRMQPDKDIGFFGKVGNAFSGETVTGEVIRWFGSPDYVDTGYRVTDEDIQKYASDLQPRVSERIAASSSSFSQFLHETDEARMTMKRRAELFSGGPAGMATGLGLTILAAGGEAVALTLLGTALMPGGGTAAAATGGIANVANGITRVHRMKAIGQALAITTAVDIPLETTRYALDNTLRPLDAMIAIGASGVLGGGLAAVKPGLFLKEVQEISRVAALKQTAAAHREAGNTAAADAIDDIVRQQVRVLPYDEVVEAATSLTPKALFAEAKSLGIATHVKGKGGKKVIRSRHDIRGDVIKKQKKAGQKIAEKQALKDVEEMSPTALKKRARDLGVDESIIKKGGKPLAKEIVKATKKVARTGEVVTEVIPKLPKGVTPVKGTRTIKGVKIRFASVLENALWKLARTKSAKERAALTRWFKRQGVKDPKQLAKELTDNAEKQVARIKSKGVSAEEAQVILDTRKMTLPAAKRTLKDGTEFVPKKGESIFTTRKKVDIEAEVDIPMSPKDPGKHPVSDEPDTAIIVDGEVVGAVPSSEMVGLDVKSLIDDVEQFTITGHGKGVRETLARGIDLTAKIPGLYTMLTPVAYRLRGQKNPFSRRWASTVMQTPREGGNNVTTVVQVNVERHLGRLGQGLEKAVQAARKAGTKLDDLTIVRALRSGDELEDGPVKMAVEALRRYNTDVGEHGLKNNLLKNFIPDPNTWFHRSYNTREFVKRVDELGEDGAITLFTGAIMNHPNSIKAGLTKVKATKIAKRIVQYGTDPQAARDWAGTKDMLQKMKKELIDDGIDEGEVDGFMELIIPRMDEQPHLTYAKRRIEMDETWSASIKIKGTDVERVVHVDEFFNNNILPNVTRYAHKIIGGAEMQKGMKHVFGKDNLTIGDALEIVRKEGRKAGDSERDILVATRAIEHSYKSIVGQPIYLDPHKMKWIMAANAFGQSTIGMVLGFAQIPEIASNVMRSGYKASLQQFPSLKEIGTIFTMGIRDAATGRQGLGLAKLQDDFSSVLETLTGVAGDYRRGDHFMRRMDEMGLDDDYLGHGALKYLEYGRQVAALNPLGIMPMDTFLRRWTVRSSFQHFVNEAYDIRGGKIHLSKGFWNNKKVRFEQIGMNEADIERLAKTLMDPDVVEVVPGLFGRYKVKMLNLEKVKDQYIFDKFTLALRRHSDHIVQRQSFGESPFWVNTAMGKLLGQYRVFMLASKSKQLAAGVARGDAREAANVVGSAGLGIIAYKMQSYYRASTMDERERRLYLARRFDEDQMIKAGILKGSYSSVFPMLMDSMAWLVGKEPVFDPSMRTTGLGIDPLTGSVPYSILYGKGWRAFRETSGALFREDKMSKEDWKNVQSLIWMTKMPGVEQLIDQMFINPANIPERK